MKLKLLRALLLLNGLMFLLNTVGERPDWVFATSLFIGCAGVFASQIIG